MSNAALAQDPTGNDNQRENRSLQKVVVGAVLISLIWKAVYFIFLDYFNRTIPLQDPFFPEVFRNQTVVCVVYLLGVATALLMLLSKSGSILSLGSLLLVITMFTLNIHQSSFNDVTFLCCGWSALWCWWFSTQLSEPNESLHPRAAWLAHAIVSLILIGGSVGKMTPEYWSGQVLYEIYFVDRDFWFYNIIRTCCSADGLRDVAMHHSRLVIVTEFACGFLWLLPIRTASWLALIVLLGIALTNSVLLFSVVTSLLGLAIVGLHQPKQLPPVSTETV